ncbi:MAG TPA: hypothetical protein VHO25_05250 [Polyangiaceae bacterium]|nr:hypothetical protein [Polyangiaceae bacterium]
MKVITSGTFAFALSALAAWGATSAGDAQAASWIRHPGSNCLLQSASSSGYTLSNKDLENNTGSAVNYICPIEDNAEHQHHTINQLTVHVKDGHTNDSVWTQACISFWGADGGSCAPSPELKSSTGGTGWTTLTFDTAAELAALTGNAADFPYVFVRLPGNATGTNSKLSGFVTYYP